MNCRSLLVVLLAVCATLAFTASVSATYHPTLGRFAQRDPKGYVDGMGLYEYVTSDPVNHKDHLGLEKKTEVTWEIKCGHHGDTQANAGQNFHIEKQLPSGEHVQFDLEGNSLKKGAEKMAPGEWKDFIKSPAGRKFMKQFGGKSNILKGALSEYAAAKGSVAAERVVKLSGKALLKEIGPFLLKRMPLVLVLSMALTATEAMAEAPKEATPLDRVVEGGKAVAKDMAAAELVEPMAEFVKEAGDKWMEEITPTPGDRMRSVAGEDAARTMRKVLGNTDPQK